jgi:acetyl esterase/lipase
MISKSFAVNQLISFYEGLLAMGYKHIIIGGESAGATFSIIVALALKDKGVRLPEAVIALSPLDDMRYDKKELFREDDMFTDMNDKIVEAYCPGSDLEDPYISPIYGDFHGFPPLLIQEGGAEVLAAGGVRLAYAAARDDAEVLLHVWKGMGHTFALQFDDFTEAASAMTEVVSFTRDKLELALESETPTQ